MGWVVLFGYVVFAIFWIAAAWGVRALVRRRWPRRPPRGAWWQLGGVALSALAGFSIGVARHVTEDDTSMPDAVPTGLGLGTLFLVVHASLILIDRRWPPRP